jgi:hypothetical protein
MHLLFAVASTCKLTGDSSALISGSSLPHTCATSGTINTIFLVAFSIIGALAFLFLVIGGLRYITASGNPESVQKAKNQIQYSLIGLVITALASVIVNFVIDRLK